MLSDHFPVYCIRKKKRERHTTAYTEARDYSKYSLGNLRTLLLDLDWDTYDNSQDPNLMYDYILSRIYRILEVMCPLRRFKQRLESARWMGPNIHKAIKTRKFYVTLFKLTRQDQYLKLAHIWRNKVNTMIDNAKSDYIKRELDRNAKNPKKFWRIINVFLDDKRFSVSDVSFYDDVTDAPVPKGSEANFLNNYFVNIATRLGMHADVNLDETLFEPYAVLDILALEETYITVREIETLAKGIDITKASFVANINSRICKDLMLLIPGKFVRLFDISLKNGIFPRKWATGSVNVIPKGGDLNQPGNWRPITQTNLYAKILERIVHKKLLRHILDNDILCKYQFGFLPGKSTQLAVFDLTKQIYPALNNKKIFGSACLDISKAFDCINHRILLLKLKNIGLSDISIAWFLSYLDRTQQLTFDNRVSDCIQVRSGIGQGTIVGPIIFLLYINDVIRTVPDVHINMYADDCMLYTTGNNWNQVYDRLNVSLLSFDAWCLQNNMVLNASKSKCLIIGSRQKLGRIDYNRKISVRNVSLEYVKKFCYLGIYLDCEMSLAPLISHVKKVVSNKTRTLVKIRKYITTSCSLAIYKQTMLPLFDYAGFLLISCNKSDRGDLQVMQNNILRTCYNVCLRDQLSLIDMHREASLVGLQLLGLMYIFKNCRNVERIFPRNTRQGNRYHFITDTYQSGKYQRSPYFKGTELWNLLPDNVISLPSLYEFKNRLKGIYSPFNDLLT